MKKYLIAMVVMLMGVASYAAEPSHQKLSLNYATINVDGSSTNLNGLEFDGAIKANDQILLYAGYSSYTKGSLKVNGTVLGGSYLYGISNTTDLKAGIYLAHASLELGSTSTSDSNIGLNAGLVSRVSDLVQLEGDISFIDGNAAIVFGSRFFIDPKVSIDISLASGDSSTTTAIGASYIF